MNPNHRIELQGKTVEITLSDNARQVLTERSEPLLVEMELYFSCLIRKKVRFYETAFEDDHHGLCETDLDDRLRIRFRPIMTSACGKDYEGDEPPVTDFPIANSKAYIPHYLNIDFRDQQWSGEFGYHSKK